MSDKQNRTNGTNESCAGKLIPAHGGYRNVLDQQLRQLGQQFVNEGGFTERLYRVKRQHRAGGAP